ncbi:hypothetical protein [Actinomadura parmotrematis]|uniref:Glycosyltransferase RgtA/B/C/D-like domain-containing protein n=1 Tax=Actinomadura parmotrematis TaxID=2864039 RepID=A0ABS7FW25_9ACTN|nr:hypothetical protein [Actinomadura parmotrematis]MBW8484622.1 hypothetical protein [Actinomadura parmotrematis]
MSAGRLLARLTVAPALLTVAGLAVGLPLLFADLFRFGPALLLVPPVAAVLLWLGLRDPDPESAGDGVLGRVSWWSTGGVIAVALVFLAVQSWMCAEQIIVRRDPASYAQFGTWLAEHGSLPIPQMRWAFGGDDPALGYASPAFYEQPGDVLVPQFMAGLPLLLAFGAWIGGTHGLLLMGPLLGAACVLSFGGVVARYVGPRWAPAGALLLALTTPMIWVSRTTLSELPALVMLLGALALLYDVRAAAASGRTRTVRSKAFLAGLTLGLIVLTRIDALRDLLPFVAFAGLLVARRRRSGYPFAAGLTVGAGAGLLEGFVLSRPYLHYLHASVEPLLAMTALVIAATAGLVVVLRAPAAADRLAAAGRAVARGRLPGAAAVLTLLVFAAFAARPAFQTVRRVPANADDRLNAGFIEAVQRIDGLPVDGTRQYGELSLYWVIWYIGVPALLLAVLGAALLARRLLRGRSAEWLAPFAAIMWTTLTTLVRPAITPDHPWATRRLVAVVVPGLLLLALWGTAWAMRRVRRAGYGRWAVRAAAVAAAAALAVPVAISSAGLAAARTDRGEVAAVRRMCTAFGGAGHSIIVVDTVTADRFLQVIRGMCGLPAARLLPGAGQADVQRVMGKVVKAGRRPVVVGAQAAQVAPYGPPTQVMALRARQDARTLDRPPSGTWGLAIDVWAAEPQLP